MKYLLTAILLLGTAQAQNLPALFTDELKGREIFIPNLTEDGDIEMVSHTTRVGLLRRDFDAQRFYNPNDLSSFEDFLDRSDGLRHQLGLALEHREMGSEMLMKSQRELLACVVEVDFIHAKYGVCGLRDQSCNPDAAELIVILEYWIPSGIIYNIMNKGMPPSASDYTDHFITSAVVISGVYNHPELGSFYGLLDRRDNCRSYLETVKQIDKEFSK